jgi:hypothetical protein
MQNDKRLPVGGPAERALKQKLREALRIAKLSKCKATISFQGLHIVVPPGADLERYYEYWVDALLNAHVLQVMEAARKARKKNE